MKKTIKVELQPGLDRRELFGNMDKNLMLLKDALGVDVMQRDNQLTIVGESAEKAEMVIRELIDIISSGGILDTQKVNYVIALVEKGMSYKEGNMDKDIMCYTHMGRPLRPKTIGQKKYVGAIRNRDIVFGIGPAGTGKTYIAVAMAVAAYKRREVQKIILARPAVEAGERLGFLPGDLQEKVDPYLRPLYDALYDVLGRESAMRIHYTLDFRKTKYPYE